MKSLAIKPTRYCNDYIYPFSQLSKPSSLHLLLHEPQVQLQFNTSTKPTLPSHTAGAWQELHTQLRFRFHFSGIYIPTHPSDLSSTEAGLDYLSQAEAHSTLSLIAGDTTYMWTDRYLVVLPLHFSSCTFILFDVEKSTHLLISANML